MNICDYIIQNDLPHQVLTDGRIAQTTTLYLSARGITSLNGFVQKYGKLFLGGNNRYSR
jgi:hypothetical protein